MSEQSLPSSFKKVIFGIVGVLLGIGVAFLAILLCGAGHGWMPSIFSLSSLIGAPLALQAAARDMPSEKKALSAISLGFGVLSLALIVVPELFFDSDLRSVRRIVEHMPFIFLLWLFGFLAWQVVAFLAFRRARIELRRYVFSRDGTFLEISPEPARGLTRHGSEPPRLDE